VLQRVAACCSVQCCGHTCELRRAIFPRKNFRFELPFASVCVCVRVRACVCVRVCMCVGVLIVMTIKRNVVEMGVLYVFFCVCLCLCFSLGVVCVASMSARRGKRTRA